MIFKVPSNHSLILLQFGDSEVEVGDSLPCPLIL